MSMYPEEPIDPYLRDLRAALGNGVTAGIGMSVGLGIFTPDGRQAGVSIRELGDGRVELTDSGETYSDLRMDGALLETGQRRSRKSEEAGFHIRATYMCESYGLTWDKSRNVIRWLGPRSKWTDAAKRICAASLAIDSWRHWMEGV